MKLKSFQNMNCSLAQSLEVLGERWTLLILRDAFFGVRRFDDFQRSLGVARNILATRLARLVEEDILERRAVSAGGKRGEYHLTEKGRALQPTLLALTQWGDAFYPPESGPRVRFCDRNTGAPIARLQPCDQDGRPLAPDEIRACFGPDAESVPFAGQGRDEESEETASEA